jgi:hypothetical protein
VSGQSRRAKGFAAELERGAVLQRACDLILDPQRRLVRNQRT